MEDESGWSDDKDVNRFKLSIWVCNGLQWFAMVCMKIRLVSSSSGREWQRVAESGRGQKTKAWTSFCRCDDPGIGDATAASEPGSQKQTVLSCTELYRVVF